MPRRTASYPHPVLGTDDVIGFVTCARPVVDVSQTEVLISIAELECTNEDVLARLEKEELEYCLRVECGATFVRQTFTTVTNAFNVKLASGDLQGTVDLAVTIRTKRQLAAYRPDGLHPDYGDARFDLQDSAIVALGPQFSFEIDNEFDPLEATGSSLFRVKAVEGQTEPVRFDFGAPGQIFILLPREAFTSYLQIQDQFSGIIHTGLVFPCLMKAIDVLRTTNGELEHQWQRQLQRLLEANSIGGEVSSEVAAAKLLNRPFWRAATQALALVSRDED